MILLIGNLLFLTFTWRPTAALIGQWRIPIEHCFTEECSQYSDRGTVILERGSDGNLTGRYTDIGSLGRDFREKLAVLAEKELVYRIRTAVDLQPFEQQHNIQQQQQQQHVYSFTDPCRLLRSDMTETLSLSVDCSLQRVLSITSQPIIPGSFDSSPCTEMDVDFARNGSFNVTVWIIDVQEGPTPDTQGYIQKVEKERMARQHGAQQDNRSFLAKYWMYILPVVIFMMLSGAANPDANQQQQQATAS